MDDFPIVLFLAKTGGATTFALVGFVIYEAGPVKNISTSGHSFRFGNPFDIGKPILFILNHIPSFFEGAAALLVTLERTAREPKFAVFRNQRR